MRQTDNIDSATCLKTFDTMSKKSNEISLVCEARVARSASKNMPRHARHSLHEHLHAADGTSLRTRHSKPSLISTCKVWKKIMPHLAQGHNIFVYVSSSGVGDAPDSQCDGHHGLSGASHVPGSERSMEIC